MASHRSGEVATRFTSLVAASSFTMTDARATRRKEVLTLSDGRQPLFEFTRVRGNEGMLKLVADPTKRGVDLKFRAALKLVKMRLTEPSIGGKTRIGVLPMDDVESDVSWQLEYCVALNGVTLPLDFESFDEQGAAGTALVARHSPNQHNRRRVHESRAPAYNELQQQQYMQQLLAQGGVNMAPPLYALQTNHSLGGAALGVHPLNQAAQQQQVAFAAYAAAAAAQRPTPGDHMYSLIQQQHAAGQARHAAEIAGLIQEAHGRPPLGYNGGTAAAPRCPTPGQHAVSSIQPSWDPMVDVQGPAPNAHRRALAESVLATAQADSLHQRAREQKTTPDYLGIIDLLTQDPRLTLVNDLKRNKAERVAYSNVPLDVIGSCAHILVPKEDAVRRLVESRLYDKRLEHRQVYVIEYLRRHLNIDGKPLELV